MHVLPCRSRRPARLWALTGFPIGWTSSSKLSFHCNVTPWIVAPSPATCVIGRLLVGIADVGLRACERSGRRQQLRKHRATTYRSAANQRRLRHRPKHLVCKASGWRRRHREHGRMLFFHFPEAFRQLVLKLPRADGARADRPAASDHWCCPRVRRGCCRDSRFPSWKSQWLFPQKRKSGLNSHLPTFSVRPHVGPALRKNDPTIRRSISPRGSLSGGS